MKAIVYSAWDGTLREFSLDPDHALDAGRDPAEVLEVFIERPPTGGDRPDTGVPLESAVDQPVGLRVGGDAAAGRFLDKARRRRIPLAPKALHLSHPNHAGQVPDPLRDVH